MLTKVCVDYCLVVVRFKLLEILREPSLYKGLESVPDAILMPAPDIRILVGFLQSLLELCFKRSLVREPGTSTGGGHWCTDYVVLVIKGQSSKFSNRGGQREVLKAF